MSGVSQCSHQDEKRGRRLFASRQIMSASASILFFVRIVFVVFGGFRESSRVDDLFTGIGAPDGVRKQRIADLQSVMDNGPPLWINRSAFKTACARRRSASLIVIWIVRFREVFVEALLRYYECSRSYSFVTKGLRSQGRLCVDSTSRPL